MCTHVNPSFTISKWGLRGSILYRHVFMMKTALVSIRKNIIYKAVLLDCGISWVSSYILLFNVLKCSESRNGAPLMSFLASITKTCLYNFDPHRPHFYIVKLGFTGVYIIFSNFADYQQSMLWAEVWKISEFFIWKFSFLVVKFQYIWIGMFS